MKFQKDEDAFTSTPEEAATEDRRDFFKMCGRFAVYTTPAVMALLWHDPKTACALSNTTPKPQTSQ
jgi:hypothetical protein